MLKLQYIPVGNIKLNPQNPRVIKDEAFKRLCASLKEDRDYFEARPILVNKDMNISFFKDGKNMFYDADGAEGLSSAAWDAISRILNHGQELSLILNASVNAYRRLDPHFEAPNQIKVSSVDRSAMKTAWLPRACLLKNRIWFRAGLM